ncbi:hypothetical protein HC251_08180 [Iamia sp. SCSIO 61187]|uniref:hypothetical protein n=1 Tax=Iamia sp. SCSIO 61187 TaxID=2722752 RepID=UPI001C624F1F|nr:hypothetical protein [Iamia sp. SCSIO 61187]QYG92422.1 hypothetical protein HC251_08180 [Iamia sp. SCSIO 61187]
MTPRPRRPHRAAAVVGLLVGLVLLLGAVVDGGLAAPTRTDPAGVTAAVPHGDQHAAPAVPREDHPAWAETVAPSGGAAAVLAALLVLLARATRAPVGAVAGPRHRSPARRAARHRGPPVLV